MSELTKEDRIKEEFERISKWFIDMNENERAVIDPIMQNSAFMKITLDDLQEVINAEGVVDHYQNGANQFGMKQSATLQSYNALVKNYAAVNKTLFSCLPKMKRPTESKFAEISKIMSDDAEERIREMKLELDAERSARINAEINAAAAKQQLEREQEKTKAAV